MIETLIASFLIIILELPFIFILIYSFRFLKKYPAKSSVPLIIITFLSMIWVFTGVIWITEIDIGEGVMELNIYIGIFCMQILVLIFSLIYVISKENSLSANIATIPLICSSIMIFSFFMESISEANLGMINSDVINGHLIFSLHPILIFIALFEMVGIFIAMIQSVINQNKISIIRNSNRIQNRLALISLIFGGIFTWIYNVLMIYWIDWFFLYVTTLLARIFFSLGFLLLALHLIENPVFILHMYGNTKSLFDEGLIGWYLITISEDELKIKSYNDLFDERCSISKEERIAFTSASMAMVGIQSSFHDASFVIPYPGHSNLISLCISFTHKDTTAKDPRLEGKGLSIFSIVMPSALIKSIGVSDTYNTIISECRKKTEDITKFEDKKFCKDIANKILKTVLS